MEQTEQMEQTEHTEQTEHDGANGTNGNDGANGTNGSNGTNGDKYATLYTGETINLLTLMSNMEETYTYTIAPQLAYTTGQVVIFGIQGEETSDHFIGQIVHYSKSTGEIQLKLTTVVGANSSNTWEVNVGGSTGKSGADGKDGNDGINGSDGKDGIDGTHGINGIHGINGTDGIDGTNGNDGQNGIDGTNGSDGPNGTDGIDGTEQTEQDGTNGTNGDKYATLYQGSSIDLGLIVIGYTYTYVLETGLAYTAGQDIIFGVRDAVTYDNFMGKVINYSTATGELKIKVQTVTGNSVAIAWEVNVGGSTGKQGNDGTKRH